MSPKQKTVLQEYSVTKKGAHDKASVLAVVY